MLKKGINQKEILIVDDDRSSTEMLTMLLETRGYFVTVARSGKGAFERISDTTDLILLDVILPDQEGFDVCRRLKSHQNTNSIPIIILSAKLLSKDIVEGLYLGADDYLTKPFEYEELVARMEAVMRRGSFLQNGNVSGGEEIIIRELRKIIDEELVVPFFQPIFLLNPLKIFGLEVLTRPTTTSVLVNPEVLFKAAIQFGCYRELEMLSWRKALNYASQHVGTEKIFLNCNPYLVEGQEFMTIKSIFENNNIDARNVVLEITERSSVSDFKIFYKHLSYYRDQGFQFAVDDVGGGYASLETIVETKPEVVKIDRHIITDLTHDKFKRSIVKFIVGFCKENNVLSIAEGIETKEDLEMVMKLGVDAGQGYYLCKPSPKINLEEMSNIYSIK